MAGLRNCKRCGRLFVYNGDPYCSKCLEEDEEIFVKVREYIEEHPKTTTFEVAEALDVPVEKILHFLRQGKLELSGENVNIILGCERCGKPITTGRYCAECALTMEREFKGRIARSSNTPDKKVKDQMYLAHRRRRK